MFFISMIKLQTSFNENRNDQPWHADAKYSAGDHSGCWCARMNTCDIQHGIENHGKNRKEEESHRRSILPLQRARQRQCDQSQKESEIYSVAADTYADFLSFEMERMRIILVANTRKERVEHIRALRPAGMLQERRSKNSNTPE